MLRLLCFIIVIFSISCISEEKYAIKELKNNSSDNSGESYLFVDELGEVYLSWIDMVGDTISVLKYSVLNGTKFSEGKTIAKGSDWFVNWADFPSFAKFPHEDKILAHWLQKSDEGTFDYDIRIAQAELKVNEWSESQILHNDGIAAEHGFVSMTPYDDKILAVWLDGRKTKDGDEVKSSADHTGAHSGEMTLRSAMIDSEGNITDREELDYRVCDCCQTDVAITSQGPIVVYRDRSYDEIRDIYYTRKIGNDWTLPKSIYDDEWKLSGCPVNGPRVAAKDKIVYIVWYSGKDETVKIVASDDGGTFFSDPVVVNQGETIGRLDIAISDRDEALISYMESDGEYANVIMRIADKELMLNDPIIVGRTSSSRSSGFPRLACLDDKLLISYTNVDSLGQSIITKAISI